MLIGLIQNKIGTLNWIWIVWLTVEELKTMKITLDCKVTIGDITKLSTIPLLLPLQIFGFKSICAILLGHDGKFLLIWKAYCNMYFFPTNNISFELCLRNKEKLTLEIVLDS